MAYTASKHNSSHGPIEPGLLGPIRCTRENSDVNMPVYIPWKNCRLAYAYAVTVTVPAASDDLDIDIELGNGGTTMMDVTVGHSGAAVGDADEFVVNTQAACENLDRDNSARAIVNLEVTGVSSKAAVVDVYMYFESDTHP